MPVVLYGCNGQSHILREDWYRALRSTFGPKREQIKEKWRELNNKELHNFLSVHILLTLYSNVSDETCIVSNRALDYMETFFICGGVMGVSRSPWILLTTLFSSLAPYRRQKRILWHTVLYKVTEGHGRKITKLRFLSAFLSRITTYY